jgi:outer membrane protein TolC
MIDSVSTSTLWRAAPMAALALALALPAPGVPQPPAGQPAAPAVITAPAGAADPLSPANPASPANQAPATTYQPPAPAPAATPTVAMPASGAAAPAPAATATGAAGTTPAGAAAETAPAGDVERITFRAAIDRTLAQNTTVQQAAAEVLRAEALVLETRSTSLPQVNANAAYTRYGYSIKFGAVVVQPHDVKTENGSISVPLVNLVNWAQWAHALDNQAIAELSVVDAKRRVATATANAYLMVIARHRTIDANRLALETAKAHFDISHQRQVAGAASRLEEVQAAQDVSNDEVLLEQSTIALRRAQEALGVLLSADGPFDTADEPVFAELPPLGEALTGAESKRADVQVLALRQTAAEHVLRDSWRDRMPTLGLTFSESLQQPSTGFALSHSWQAVLQLTVPIYDGGLRTGEKRERRALVDEAAANLTGGKVQARSDVRIANDEVRLADQGLVSARRAAAQAHEALDIVNLSYGAGASTSLDVLDAQRRARDADTAVATAEDAARQARLDYLLGSGVFP